MGKIALILVLSVTILFATIMVTVHQSSSSLPEEIALNQSEMLGNKLGNYAISYSIKNLVDNKITLSANDRIATGYDNFHVFDGRIDSIIYTTNANLDTVTIYCKTTYNVAGKYSSNYRTAQLRINSSGSSYNFDAAIITAGTIRLKGHGSVVGDIKENQVFSFEDVFGTPASEIKIAAQEMGSYFENPSNHQAIGDSITWMEGDFHPSSGWSGRGILIVNGDYKMSAHTYFDGIVYVTGEFEITAHSQVVGTAFIQYTGQSEIKAHSGVIYDEDEIDNNLGALTSGTSYELVGWE